MELKTYREVTVTLKGTPTIDDVLAAITELRSKADADLKYYTEEVHFIGKPNIPERMGRDDDYPVFMLRAFQKGD